jgi:cell division septal protein FtsQ
MQVPWTLERLSPLGLRRAALVPLGLLGAGIVVGLGLVGFRAIEATGSFGVDRVEVVGAGGGNVAGTVRKTVFATTGSTSMLSINPDGIAVAVASLPHVQTAVVDRAFPNTLTIKIVPERAVAMTTTPKGRVVLAASGRVLGPATPGAMGLPLIAAAPSDIPGAGGTVTAPGVVAELALASARSRTLRFRAIGYGQDGLVGQTAQGVEVRVGDAHQLATKLKVARSVLRRAGTTVQYVDVTVPAAPVLRESSADPLTANAPAPTTAAATGDATDLGTWIAGATPAESIHAVFG